MRKTKTSTEVKRRYNVKTYKSVYAQLPIALVQKFEDKAKLENRSKASIIKELLEQYLKD